MSETILQHPLIIIFYLDRELMMQPDIMKPFAESVNLMLSHKNANALAFFIPTDGEERVECINPVMLAQPDLDKVYTIVEDLKKNFMVEIPTKDNEIVLDEKPCDCGGNPDAICQCNKQND